MRVRAEARVRVLERRPEGPDAELGEVVVSPTSSVADLRLLIQLFCESPSFCFVKRSAPLSREQEA